MKSRDAKKRLETLEWLAEFVMACPQDSIPVQRQQQLIRQLLNVTEMDGADFHHFFASAERRNANLKSRVFNELAAEVSRNRAFENH